MKKTIARRDFLKGSAAGAVALSLPALSSGADEVRERKPNIIFLLTDDQRWDTMGCVGNKIIQTPNMDNMAQDGVLFNNAFVTTSICAASRASILSGQYVSRHGIDDFSKSFSATALEQTYPILLRNAGYRIGFIGKYGVGRDLPTDRFDYWRGFPGQGRYEHKDEDGGYLHLTQIMEDQAVEFLGGCSASKPFCLSVSFKSPHCQDNHPRQFLFDRRYEDLYKDVTIPVPKTGADSYFDRFPEFFKKNNEGRRRWEVRFSTPELYQDMVKGYYRLITGVDRVVGRVRDELKRLGFEDNTILIFTADNGFYLGEHGLAGKWYGHEESIRVPLIVCDPRLPDTERGQRRNEMALNVDIAPTILSKAGVAIPTSMQGSDLTPLIDGKQVAWRRDFFYEHLFNHPGIPKSEGLRTEKYKYLRYIDQEPPYEELYDLENDPHEETNLVAPAEYRSILTDLRERYFQLKEMSK
jgi:arylsulfatase A-like enzyme